MIILFKLDYSCLSLTQVFDCLQCNSVLAYRSYLYILQIIYIVHLCIYVYTYMYTPRDIHIHNMLKWKSLGRVPLFATRGLQPTRLLCPWDYSGKNTGVGCCALLQGIFPTPLLILVDLVSCICRKVLYHQSPLESPDTDRISFLEALLKNLILCSDLIIKLSWLRMYTKCRHYRFYIFLFT